MSSHVLHDQSTNWTAADLVARFGPIPLSRICLAPAPGMATEDDVVRLHDQENRLFELVDGTLVEKTVGTYESYLATLIARLLGNFVAEHDLGIVLGADGMLRFAPGLVRIPDVSFISWQRLPGRKIPDQAVADLVPDLAVEVISRSNTEEEMDRKLKEYFAAGTQVVWYVYPTAREICVFASAERLQKYGKQQSVDGGDLLPGFRLELSDLFADPQS